MGIFFLRDAEKKEGKKDKSIHPCKSDSRAPRRRMDEGAANTGRYLKPSHPRSG